MGKIKILPDLIASKIAAGEVIERPASVVKELIENSIDAQADKIKIELKSGGKRLIKVTDNGTGMSGDDALLCLERHATSKITKSADLFEINTLGFRGEALPSIASVSKFELSTKMSDQLSGTKITVNGGKIKKVEEIGCPVGTSIEVRSIFFNTNPRLKFLKKPETELNRILEIIFRESISKPNIGFDVYDAGEPIFRFASADNQLHRITQIITNIELFDIQYDVPGLRITGYLSGPLGSRSNTTKLYTYVNDRPVRDRFLTRIIIDSYGKLLEKGRYPVGALFVYVLNEDVDVNVHPTKNEVRFKNQYVVAEAIKQSINSMLQNAPWIKSYKQGVESAVGKFYESRQVHELGQGNNKFTKKGIKIDYKDKQHEGYFSTKLDESYEKDSRLFKGSGFFSDKKVIGQAGGLYIICESEVGLLIIDQHAAHERVNYEKYKTLYSKSGLIESQELLLPELIELSALELRLFNSNKEKLEELGFNIENFGDKTIRVRAVPSILNNHNIVTTVLSLLSDIGDNFGKDYYSNKVDLLIANTACRKSIMANDIISMDEINQLLNDLDKVEFPHSCPHGRPVVTEISFQRLEKLFRRT